MDEFNNNMDMINELNEVRRNSEIPEGQDYSGEKNFGEAFSGALQDFVDRIKELFGAEVSDDTKGEGKEVDESLTEKASDVMAEVFDEQTINEWGTMSMEQREAKLSEYYSRLGEDLGIDAKGVIIEDCDQTVGAGVLGYNSGDGYLHIDSANLEDPSKLMDVLDTTTHEARHQLQSEAIADPSRFPEISPALISEWEHNMQNYDTGDFGFEGYYNQGVEVDARVFAADVLDAYKNKLGL